LRSQAENESLFLDILKSFIIKCHYLFFEKNEEKPTIKITKLPASFAFNFTLVLNKPCLNLERSPILLSTSIPIFSIEQNDRILKINIEVKNKLISKIHAQILTNCSLNTFLFSLLKIRLTLEESS
jgi:hypothetical protein